MTMVEEMYDMIHYQLKHFPYDSDEFVARMVIDHLWPDYYEMPVVMHSARSHLLNLEYEEVQ